MAFTVKGDYFSFDHGAADQPFPVYSLYSRAHIRIAPQLIQEEIGIFLASPPWDCFFGQMTSLCCFRNSQFLQATSNLGTVIVLLLLHVHKRIESVFFRDCTPGTTTSSHIFVHSGDEHWVCKTKCINISHKLLRIVHIFVGLFLFIYLYMHSSIQMVQS